MVVEEEEALDQEEEQIEGIAFVMTSVSQYRKMHVSVKIVCVKYIIFAPTANIFYFD